MTMRSAFFIAQEGRPGPVLVDITKDVTAAVTEYTPYRSREPVVRSTDIIKEADLETGGGDDQQAASVPSSLWEAAP